MRCLYLFLKGVVGELFKLVQVSQRFCLHGAQRAERRYDLRHCHLELDADYDSFTSADNEGSPYRLHQRLAVIQQALATTQGPDTKAELTRLLRDLPLFYALHLEDFRLLRTGTPVQVQTNEGQHNHHDSITVTTIITIIR